MDAIKREHFLYAVALTFIVTLAIVLRMGSLLVHSPFIDAQSQMAIQPMQDIITHQPYAYNESSLLLGITVVPYYALGGILTLYQTIFLVHTVFILLAFFLVYLFAFKISRKHLTALMAVALFAVMPTAVQAQSFANYIGDFFVEVLTVLGIYFFLASLEKTASAGRRTIYLAVCLFTITFADKLWNGGIYAVIVFLCVGFFTIIAQAIGTKKAILLMLCLIPALFIIYDFSSSSLLFHDVSNVNAYNQSQVIMLNILTFISQQNQSINSPIINLFGFLVFFIPILLSIFMAKGENSWLIAIIAMALISSPIALVNSRFESLIIMPFAILGAVGIQRIRFPGKVPVYVICLLCMALLCIAEVWNVFSYF